MRDTTPVPNAPYFVNGVTNPRGQVTTVTDLRRRFGLEEMTRNDNTRIIIVKPDGVPIGMVVDSVSEVLAGCLQRIPEPVPELVTESGGSGIDAEYIKGVGKLDGGQLLILLDLEKVLVTA